MGFVDLVCKDKEDMLRRLAMFGAFYGTQKWTEGLELLSNSVWKSNIEILGVILYGNRMMLVVLKVEYVNGSPSCRIEVSSMEPGGVFPRPGRLTDKEARAEKLLIELFSLSHDQLYSFAADHDMVELFASQQGELRVYVCPHCGARYSERKLRHGSDGSVLCQNCDMWILPPPSSSDEQKAE